jgi:prefoldin alpha subunit
MDITQLSPQQLEDVRKNLTAEVQFLTQSYGNLKVARGRYAHSLEALDEFKEDNQDQEIMVPLTTSMYIPGTLANVEKVMVDIGTGFFLEKPIPEAKAFVETKLSLLEKNLASAEQTIRSKSKDLELINGYIQAKINAMNAEQRAQLEKKSSTM